jgi:two-component system cell cycle response regulator
MRVLIVDDDPVTHRLLQATLQGWQYETISAYTAREAEDVLVSGRARLAVCDWVLPDMTGPELCRRVRRAQGGRFAYFIILSARGRKEDVVEGLRAGADDYVVKPFDQQELEVRVRAGQRIIELQQELLDAQHRLQQMAAHDGLTGLWNHQAILEALDREFARHVRQSTPLSVIMADLDHFKQVNDTWGHPAGDAVLAAAARTILNCVRPYDSVGRYGGEEFLILLPGCSGDLAEEVARRALEAVGNSPVQTGAGAIAVTISAGTASTADLPEANAQLLVRRADEALYKAKLAGRGCVVRGKP